MKGVCTRQRQLVIAVLWPIEKGYHAADDAQAVETDSDALATIHVVILEDSVQVCAEAREDGDEA